MAIFNSYVNLPEGTKTYPGYPWVVSNMTFIFHVIYGMSSFPLTNSIIFQDGLKAPTSNQ